MDEEAGKLGDVCAALWVVFGGSGPFRLGKPNLQRQCTIFCRLVSRETKMKTKHASAALPPVGELGQAPRFPGLVQGCSQTGGARVGRNILKQSVPQRRDVFKHTFLECHINLHQRQQKGAHTHTHTRTHQHTRTHTGARALCSWIPCTLSCSREILRICRLAWQPATVCAWV